MKRKITLLLCFLSVALFATAEGKYTIKGKVSQEFNGKKMYLSLYTQSRRLPDDSTVVTNGTFTFTGDYSVDDIATIFTRSKNRDDKGLRCLVNVENGTINVDCTKNPVVIKNGKLCKAISEYNDSITFYDKEEKKVGINEMYTEYQDPKTTKERKQFIVRTVNDFDKRFNRSIELLMKKNIKNVFGAYLLSNIAYKYSDAEVEAFVNEGGKEILGYNPIKQLSVRINSAKLRRPGNTYIDFEQPDKDGKMHKLSEYIGKNKYVLVDFWASWCAPCRAEIPNVKKAYEKFHDKGFEVVAVSLDSKRDAWLQAVEKEQMAWPQLSDVTGWKNAASQKYGVNSIPCTMLIDANGKIIGGDYRGEQLVQKLTELFK